MSCFLYLYVMKGACEDLARQMECERLKEFFLSTMLKYWVGTKFEVFLCEFQRKYLDIFYIDLFKHISAIFLPVTFAIFETISWFHPPRRHLSGEWTGIRGFTCFYRIEDTKNNFIGIKISDNLKV